METLVSNLDRSVNFVHERGFESRYVQRPNSDYFIAYLSSHTGCNKSCRFCHLTQTGQTDMIPAEINDFTNQVWPIFSRNAKMELAYRPELKKMHYNFMARGEPLANPTILFDWWELKANLSDIAYGHEVSDVSYKISTIMPAEIKDRRLVEIFPLGDAELYYSLYSLDKRFRKRWLPKAIHPYLALAKLKEWQDKTGGAVVIHFPLIAGENDSYQQTDQMIDLIKGFDLDTRFNLVRYNPPDETSRESDNIEGIFASWKAAFPESKMIERVGYDVKASCGMFVS